MNILSYNDREDGIMDGAAEQWDAVQRCTMECNEVNSGLVECSGQA